MSLLTPAIIFTPNPTAQISVSLPIPAGAVSVTRPIRSYVGVPSVTTGLSSAAASGTPTPTEVSLELSSGSISGSDVSEVI